MPTFPAAFRNLAGEGGNFFEKKQNKSCCLQNVFNFPVAIAVIPKIAFIDQLYAKIVGIRMGKLPENGWTTL